MNIWAKRWSGSAWFYYVLFVGHADYKASNGATWIWRHNDVAIGTMSRSSFWESATKNIFGEWETNSDSSRINVGSEHATLRNNWVYSDNSNMAYSLTYKLGTNMYIEGDTLCKVGMGQSGPYKQCGAHTSKNNAVWTTRCCQDTANIKVYNLNRADFNGSQSGWGLSPGDSGGVIYGGWERQGNGNGWAGIAGPNSLGFFSLPNKIENDMNATVCLDSTCSN